MAAAMTGHVHPLAVTELAVAGGPGGLGPAAGIFGKLDLAPSDDNRRVLAVLADLDS